MYAGQKAAAGQIIIRQRGTRYLPGKNVVRAGDDTLYTKVAGVVSFTTKNKVCFDGNRRSAKVVHVRPA